MNPASAHDPLRLFLALWPDTAAQAWLRACDAAIGWPVGAARGGPERWHMTLHFLGALPRALSLQLLPALQHPFDPFAFELGRVEVWPRGLVVVEPAHAVRALHDLQAELGAALQRAGQRAEVRHFKPHVTLARRASRARLSAPPTLQRWPVSTYALVASAGGRYRNLALYPRGTLMPAPDPAVATLQILPAPAPMPR